MSDHGYDLAGSLPLEAGETIDSTAEWKALGLNCMSVVTTRGRIFVLRIEAGPVVMLAGPLLFVDKGDPQQRKCPPLPMSDF